MTGQDLIEKKFQDSKNVVKEAFQKYRADSLAIAFTGGKDSMLTLYIIREVCLELKTAIPRCFCIDEGDMFDEVKIFIDRIKTDYKLSVEYIHNSDVSKAAGGKLGAAVKVASLNERNRSEVKRLGYEEDEFPYEPESFVGNHLMKTVAMNVFLEKNNIKAFFEGIRWDESASRASEKYFSPRPGTQYSPDHMRICPILHFTERDVWDTMFKYKIPVCELYRKGYRSLGARVTTTKMSDIPAWEQDLENTSERGGRRQDKEHLMSKLRELGYM